ncbi:type I-E CRISPR-associated protein Cas5/CasD [Photobacterium damselae]|uniref:type I-E CRISPR-associated protein Cas5/CasD n=1 Tax=Photobacterium damselae TaxID=38293 RepID=UPI001EEF4BE5|nr:type I-E CRISPR-associated protein Cas5/CasD [Photobacterium damselae]UKA31827.1 type I-E CRISPR-associated protein Cas5/CasD [Photobacterium damselae subsp. damselae]
MQPYLVFRLYGAMASWGQPAVGGDRHTGVIPSRSALLGLLGAGLGIKRDDQPTLAMLQKSVQFSIKQLVPSSLLRDYHTTQVAVHNNKRRYHTRKQEIDLGGELKTVLSSRDYRCDGIWVVAISLTSDAIFSLEQLQQALLTPVYPLCLGRKSCPPALPLMPTILEPCSLKQALDTSFPPITGSEKSDRYWFGCVGQHRVATYYWPGNKAALGDIEDNVVITTQPWDEPLNRQRWQFTQRIMHQVTLPILEGE